MIDYHNTIRITGHTVENEQKFPDLVIQRKNSRYRLQPHQYRIIQLANLTLSDIPMLPALSNEKNQSFCGVEQINLFHGRPSYKLFCFIVLTDDIRGLAGMTRSFKFTEVSLIDIWIGLIRFILSIHAIGARIRCPIKSYMYSNKQDEPKFIKVNNSTEDMNLFDDFRYNRDERDCLDDQEKQLIYEFLNELERADLRSVPISTRQKLTQLKNKLMRKEKFKISSNLFDQDFRIFQTKQTPKKNEKIDPRSLEVIKDPPDKSRQQVDQNNIRMIQRYTYLSSPADTDQIYLQDMESQNEYLYNLSYYAHLQQKEEKQQYHPNLAEQNPVPNNLLFDSQQKGSIKPEDLSVCKYMGTHNKDQKIKPHTEQEDFQYLLQMEVENQYIHNLQSEAIQLEINQNIENQSSISNKTHNLLINIITNVDPKTTFEQTLLEARVCSSRGTVRKIELNPKSNGLYSLTLKWYEEMEQKYFDEQLTGSYTESFRTEVEQKNYLMYTKGIKFFLSFIEFDVSEGSSGKHKYCYFYWQQNDYHDIPRSSHSQ